MPLMDSVATQHHSATLPSQHHSSPSALGACLFSLTLGIVLTSVCSAAFPTVTHHRPLGVTRGQESTITFYGNQIGDARQALCDLTGIEILEVKAIDNRKVEVKVKTDKSLNPGLYPIRLATATGVSNMQFLGVGAMPIVQEVEPNNAFDTPQAIEMNRTIEGNIDREDVDCFRVKLKAGQKLTVEIEGIRLSYDIRNQFILDPFVAILDSKRFEVAVSDDSALLQQDSVCSFTPEEDGEYTILVRESSFRGQKDRCGYRLHVGSYPRPITVIPSGGKHGEVLSARLIDIDGTVSDAKVQLPSEPVDEWPVITENEKGVSPSPNWIRVGSAPIVTEVEPNDDYKNGQKCEVPALLCGVVNKENDYDCFAFQCKKGESFRVQLYARKTLRSPLDGVIHVFGPDNKTLKDSDDIGPNPDGMFDFTAAAEGTHTVRVYDHLRGGSPLHNYVIDVSRLEPGFKLSLKELRRSEPMVVPVPQGGYGAMVMLAARQRFNEEIQFELDALPKGVTAEVFPLPKGRSEIPVLLKAAADAPIEAALFDVRGKGKLGDKEITGDLKQHHKIVLGQNRREMLGYETERAAVAVCEPMPFEVELVQPKTPILRRGSKDLVVKIKRKEGFENAVYFKTLYNPPGVSVNNSRKIDKGQTEVKLPITANKSAVLGQWPIAMQVSYGTDKGTQTVATKPIMLTIEEPVFNYTFPRAAAELGSETNLVIGMEKLREIEGELEVQLVGIPNGVTCDAPTQKIKLTDTAVSFPLKVAADGKVGRHKTLNVYTRIVRDGETMIQTDGTGEIRVDKPLPPKKDAPKKEPAKPKVQPKKEAAPKPLSRLEQLRQLKEGS